MWQSEDMDKTAVLQILRAHEPELRAAGIVHLRLFGSVARGEQRPDSDVDLMAEFDRTKQLGIFGVVGIKLQLEELLGRRAAAAVKRHLLTLVPEYCRPQAMNSEELALPTQV